MLRAFVPPFSIWKILYHGFTVRHCWPCIFCAALQRHNGEQGFLLFLYVLSDMLNKDTIGSLLSIACIVNEASCYFYTSYRTCLTRTPSSHIGSLLSIACIVNEASCYFYTSYRTCWTRTPWSPIGSLLSITWLLSRRPGELAWTLFIHDTFTSMQHSTSAHWSACSCRERRQWVLH